MVKNIYKRLFYENHYNKGQVNVPAMFFAAKMPGSPLKGEGSWYFS